jgi:hypothetical protein
MNSHYTEVAAAWIVAIALIAAIAVHTFLPVVPPRLEPGVVSPTAARAGTPTSNTDRDIPLIDSPDGPT